MKTSNILGHSGAKGAQNAENGYKGHSSGKNAVQKSAYANAGHRERLRKKFLTSGIDSFEQHEVLEMLLFSIIPQRDTNKLAHSLVNMFGSISAVLDAPQQVLSAVSGLSEVSASYVSMLAPMFNYYRDNREMRPQFNSVAAVVSYASGVLGNSGFEKTYVLCLDPSARLIGKRTFTSNDQMCVKIEVKDVVETAQAFDSKLILLVHNHAKGDASPSGADRDFTRSAYNTLRGLGIKLYDHIIYADTGFFSFARANFMEKLSRDYVQAFSGSSDNLQIAQSEFEYKIN